MKTQKALIYIRVSSRGQAEHGTSLEDQEKVCLRKAEEMNALIVDTISDRAVSGGFYAARPGIQDACKRIEAGEANLLICMNLSRYSRDAEHQQTIKKRIERAGGRLVLCDMHFDETPEGDLAFGIMGNFAEYERKVIRKRTMTGRRRRAEQGLQPCRNVSPLGYHVVTKEDVLTGRYPVGTVGTYQVVEETAGLVRELFARCAAGAPLRALARWLSEQNASTSQGGSAWYASTIRAVLTNPVYKGDALFGKKEVVPDESRVERGYRMTYTLRNRSDEECVHISAPALIDAETWQMCQSRLADNKKRLSGPKGRRYLLSGIVRCMATGNRKAASRTKWALYYTCASNNYGRCSCSKLRADVIEPIAKMVIRLLAHSPELVKEALEAYSEKPKETDEIEIRRALESLADREKATVQAQIAGIQAGVDPSLYTAAFADIAANRKVLQERLSALTAHESTNASVPINAADLLAEAALDVEEVLLSDDQDVNLAQKNAYLSRVIHAIYPQETGFRFEIASPPGVGVTVQQISSWCQACP